MSHLYIYVYIFLHLCQQTYVRLWNVQWKLIDENIRYMRFYHLGENKVSINTKSISDAWQTLIPWEYHLQKVAQCVSNDELAPIQNTVTISHDFKDQQ